MQNVLQRIDAVIAGTVRNQDRRVVFDVDKVVRDIEKSGMPDPEKRIRVLRRSRYKQLQELIP